MQIYTKCMYFQAKCNKFFEKLTIIIKIYGNTYKIYVFSFKM